MNFKTIVPIFLLVLFSLGACTKKDQIAKDNGLAWKEKYNSLSNAQLNEPVPMDPQDYLVSTNFSTELNAVPNITMNDLFTMSHSNSDYVELANASVAFLQQGDFLDSLKYYLNITDNYDPHLIIAAKLINDAYTLPKPVDFTPGSPGDNLRKCIFTALGLEAVFGVAEGIKKVNLLMNGATFSEMRTAIHAMGWRWFAGALVRIGLRASNTVGFAIMAYEFTVCMIWDGPPPMDSILYYVNMLNLPTPTPAVPMYPAADYDSYISTVHNWALQNNMPTPVNWTTYDLKSLVNMFNMDSNHPIHIYQLNSDFQAQLAYYIDYIFFTTHTPDLQPIPL